MKISAYLLITIEIIISSSFTSVKPSLINSPNFKNLYKVTTGIYRSDQPSKKGMEELEKLGIKTILNLRNHRNDNMESRKTALILRRVKINAWKMDYSQLVEALKIMKNSEKPILVHCLHGSDRTGAVIAGYRIAYENWTKEEAISEFREEKYGFHEEMFPNILDLLEQVDSVKLKEDLGIQ